MEIVGPLYLASLDVAKIKSDLTSMQGCNPGCRKFLQNFNCSVGSLEQMAMRDAADQIIYGPAPPPIYSASKTTGDGTSGRAHCLRDRMPAGRR